MGYEEHGKRTSHTVDDDRRGRFTVRNISVLLALLMASCGVADTQPDVTETSVISSSAAEEVMPVTKDTAAPIQETEPETQQDTEAAGKIVYDYVHGDEGYYCLLEDGIKFDLISQVSGTCWICASYCAIYTAHQIDNDGKPLDMEPDQLRLVDEIYDDDKAEGIFTSEGVNKGALGGNGAFVVNELSQGFFDGLVLDRALYAKGWSPDQIKEGIRKYGALYIGIPDSDRSKKAVFGQYYTMNFPDAEGNDFDHSIAVIGWDDHFPKEYFRTKADHDGAWICYNSNYSKGYCYISYDTPFDQIIDPPLFLSVSDRYSKVLSHDCGYWYADPVITGDTTVTANVFEGEGTLSAVGTYSLADDQDITIQIMTPDLSECLYTQEHHIDKFGYHVIDLDQPQQVDRYAIAISFAKGAPVEGKSKTLDYDLRVETVSDSGQSYILIDGEWLDMSEEDTWEQCGFVTGNTCIRALYTE